LQKGIAVPKTSDRSRVKEERDKREEYGLEDIPMEDLSSTPRKTEAEAEDERRQAEKKKAEEEERVAQEQQRAAEAEEARLAKEEEERASRAARQK
ncbi:hypothetical protein NL317_27635, partial [Klebsiella pneumoniae]|nr:hypothetical protein [Klebsiella pneumoniae]